MFNYPEWRKRNPEIIRENHRRRAARIRAANELFERYGLVSPLLVKEAARRQVLKAIKQGVLIRPSVCELCGEDQKRIVAHHYDYDKSLSVVWICDSCHRINHPSKIFFK